MPPNVSVKMIVSIKPNSVNINVRHEMKTPGKRLLSGGSEN